MPIKKIQYLKVDGKECCRCGAPFYRLKEVDTDLRDVPEVPTTSPFVLRYKHDGLKWKWMTKADIAKLRHNPIIGWRKERVDPTPDGLFCKSCDRRDDKWIGIDGRPHIVGDRP